MLRGRYPKLGVRSFVGEGVGLENKFERLISRLVLFGRCDRIPSKRVLKDTSCGANVLTLDALP